MSNQYTYYKKYYKKLKKANKKLKKKNYKLKLENIDLKKELGNTSKKDIFERFVSKDYSNIKISIKTPNPKGAHDWGDYFYAISLKKSLLKKGFNVVLHEREDWYGHENEDIVIVIRGLKKYNVNYDSINIMWNLSHPELVSMEEYEEYDLVFIASEKYTRLIKKEINTPVKQLLQCFDPEVFYRKENENINDEILFVGSTRNVYRNIIKDISSTNHSFSVYGPGWEKFIDEKYIKGDFIPNNVLNQYYSSCKILLNDHWEDMKEQGFISNRIFDALACETFVISDKLQEVHTLFEGNVVTYETAEDLNEKINYYLANDDIRKEKAKKGQQMVLKYHTFDNRVEEIIESLNQLNFKS